TAHLAFEATPLVIDFGLQPTPAKLLNEQKSARARLLAQTRDKKTWRAHLFPLLLLKQHNKPLHPDSKPDRRNVGSAQISHQTIVAASSSDCVLGAETVCNQLESCPHVIVQAANNSGIYCIARPKPLQIILYRIEVRAAVFADVIDQQGSAFEQCLTLFDLAVEHAQRVGFPAAQAVRTELVPFCSEEILQDFPVCLPALRAPKRVDVKDDPGNADPVH